ncbi:glycosyltransferase family 4 protein [Candidatus Gottesmanbacteria bacterium]|nr:glycosyltransferase family 4 protein [Candidatus Gottesmanbacteria bacterium]
MIIGVDAGALCVKDERLRVGVFTLLRSLVIGLARARPHDTIRLFVFDNLDPDITSLHPGNVEIRVLPRFLYSKVQMTLSLSLHPCDVFLGTGQYVPLGARRAVGWIYDLGFLEHPEFYPDSANQLVSITKTVISRSERIITISEHVKNQIVNYFHLDQSRIAVCYPGIGLSENKTIRSKSQKRPYFLFVGAFKPGKNIPFLLHAFSKAVNMGLKEDLILVGSDKWMSEDILGIRQKEKLEGRVFIKGFVDDVTLQRLYKDATATVIPSLVEGFGFPVVESFRAGTPVIGSTAGSLPEVIGKAGICIDPTDEESLVRALLQFEKKGVRVGYQQHIQTQREKFTVKRFVKNVLRVIDTVAGRRV